LVGAQWSSQYSMYLAKATPRGNKQSGGDR
jgi:hypothetical protein